MTNDEYRRLFGRDGRLLYRNWGQNRDYRTPAQRHWDAAREDVRLRIQTNRRAAQHRLLATRERQRVANRSAYSRAHNLAHLSGWGDAVIRRNPFVSDQERRRAILNRERARTRLRLSRERERMRAARVARLS